jgi:drug/metabolite transporter (DMT)-like permease
LTRSGTLPIAAAAVAGVQAGAAMVATRFVLAEVDPAWLGLLRYLIGFLCLVPALMLSRRVRIARGDLVPIALLGIAQFGILILLLNFGLQRVPAARAALIFSAAPALTMVLAAALGIERLSAGKAGGVTMTIVGVAVTLGAGAFAAGDAPGEWLGAAAVFASALAAAVCSVLYRPYLRSYAPLAVSALAMLAAIAFLAVPAAATGGWRALPAITAGGWAAILFVGLTSGSGYWLWLWALKHAPPTQVTVFLALGPVTAAGLGAVLLAEPVSGAFWLGSLCVGLGLWLASRQGGERVPGAAVSLRRPVALD